MTNRNTRKMFLRVIEKHLEKFPDRAAGMALTFALYYSQLGDTDKMQQFIDVLSEQNKAKRS